MQVCQLFLVNSTGSCMNDEVPNKFDEMTGAFEKRVKSMWGLPFELLVWTKVQDYLREVCLL